MSPLEWWQEELEDDARRVPGIRARRRRPRANLQPCGTEAAYQRHVRWHDEPCMACRIGHNAYVKAQNRATDKHRYAEERKAMM